MKKLSIAIAVLACLSIIRTASAQTPTPTINGTPPPFVFNGAGVSQVGQTFTFAGSGTNACTVANGCVLYNGTTATTQAANDNSTKVATTAYVASPGAITPTSVTSPITDKGGQVYNAKAFGAKGDGVFLYDAVISSGSPNLASATANWTSSDVGKSIEVNNGSTGASVVISTIKTITDANHVVLNANASATVSSAGFIEYGTDDTAAINALITTVTNAGGGNIFYPCGVYILNGALGGTQGENALIQLPVIAQGGTQPLITLEFDGCTANQAPIEDGFVSNIMQGGSILYGMTTESGSSPAIISGPLSLGGFDNVTFISRNLTVRTRQNPLYSALMLSQVANSALYNVRVDVQQGPATTNPTFPTHSGSRGISMGWIGNFGTQVIQDSTIKGYYAGIYGVEHLRIATSKVESSVHGFECDGAGHLNQFDNFNIQESSYNLYATSNASAGCPVSGSISVENPSVIADVYGPFVGDLKFLLAYTPAPPIMTGITSKLRVTDLAAPSPYSGAIQHIQSCATQGASAPASVSCTFTNAIGPGHLIYACLENADNASISNNTIVWSGDPGAFIIDLPVTSFGSSRAAACAYVLNTTGGSKTITLTSTDLFYPALTVDEFICPFCSLDKSDASATGTSSSPASASITPSASGELILGFIGTDGGSVNTVTAGSGYTRGTLSPFPSANEYLTQKLAAGITGTATLNTSGAWLAHVAAFKP